MAIYAIGDIQGCYDPLRRLLDTLAFDPAHDRLWFTGDLVNRGPQSLAVLRFIKTLDACAVMVLGNHDLSLLAIAEGFQRAKPYDTIADVLAAPDRDALLDWLRRRPMLHHDAELGFTMAHAGLAPQWDLAQACACAAELETTLRGPAYRDFLARMFGNEPQRWRDDLRGVERLRCIVNIFTRMRFCSADGTLSLTDKGAPGSQPPHLMPWFHAPGRRNAALNIVFGHWAALGFYREPGVYALDSGCVWGHRLSALRLDGPEQVYAVACR
ncbi:MAG: symmetrical bis(5'-nucleosyl)-tetraphosphatase [Gammaproteobacteria bacterium]